LSEELKIRRMKEYDLPFAQAVRAFSGWNQTQQDWDRILLYEPRGCFVAEWNGQLAGTAATVSYGDVMGWIGMVLVHPDFRRRGIASALLNHCIVVLRSVVRCIKLDATPEGKKVYDRLGFRTEYNLSRWERTLTAGGSVETLCLIEERDWLSLVKLDAPIFGADREQWLRMLVKDSRRALLIRDDHSAVTAYGLARAGERAEYLGPVVATRPADGEALVRKLLDETRQEIVYWDIPDDNKEAVSLAEELGFVRQRPFIRMWLGEPRVESDPEKQWAISDPAAG